MPNTVARTLEHLAIAARDGVLRLAIPLINASVPRRGYTMHPDLHYGPLPRQRLDLYAPDRRAAPAPVLLFFFGGSWQSGSKDIYRAFGQAFAAQGIVTAVADYRVYPEVKYPAFIEDGALAAAWLHANAAAHGGDPKRLILSGHSAGAYIAAMLALNAHYLQAANLTPKDIAGVIGIAGPYDFLPLKDPVLIDIFGGDRVTATQPIQYVRAGAPPMLLAHGTPDITVRAANSRRLAARLREAGNAVELVEYPGVGHLGILLSLARGLRRRTTLYADMLRFITSV